MRYHIIFLGLSLFILSSMLGCDKLGLAKPKFKEALTAALPVKGTVIAKVNNSPITLEDLDREVATYNDLIPDDKPENKITTRDKKIEYLKNEMVRRMLLYQEALNRGLDRKEEIVQALERTKQELLVMELFRKEAEKVEVSSKEIEDYYNNYKDQLKEPEERQLREIVVSSEQDARDILIQLLQGADFATLAKDRSKSSSAKDGGDLGFIKKGQKSAQFDAVAFSDSLEVGKMSSIFKCPDGYYIVKLEAKRGGKQRSLADMWDDIRKGLTFLKQRQKIEDLVGKLSQDAKLEFHEGEIK
ncbi:MAG: peptidyl-prolyl cis-trans isomerase [Candidatus Omnitrophica bacterium]|nr:peptidyl-prolyl cis-trans isomerase [Candidatus Omnitrophota bacterium]